MYRRFGKRLFDLLIAVPLAVAGAPFMLLLSLLVRWQLGAPVLFRQQRPGRNGRLFIIYKFRTMTDARDEEGNLLADAQRLPRFGHLLRATSFDELPELWNVIRGDMSLVGPRPLLTEYLPHYTPEQMRRHEVEPGVTGWAQVNGRNALSWEAKFAHDVWYVDHVSFILDLRILLQTAWKLVRREGITMPGEATTKKFTETL